MPSLMWTDGPRVRSINQPAAGVSRTDVEAVFTARSTPCFPEIVAEVLAHAKAAGFVTVCLRPRFSANDDPFSGDIDLLIDPTHVNALLRAAWRTLAARGLDFAVLRNRHDKLAMRILDPKANKTLTIEVWQRVQVKRAAGFASTIGWQDLRSHVEPHHEQPSGYRLKPETEAYLYLSHLNSKRKTLQSALVRRRLDYYAAQTAVSPDVQGLLRHITSQTTLDHASAVANQWLHDAGLLEAAPRLSRVAGSLRNLFKDRRLSASRRSAVVAFAGPDGVGKTTVIQHLLKQADGSAYYFKFKNAYRKAIAYHVSYFFMKRVFSRRAGVPLQKNQVDELAAPMLLPLAAARLSVRDWATRVLGRTAYCDRAFSDLLIAGSRFQGAALSFNDKALRRSWLAPRPRALVHLTAPVDVIRSRKTELTVEQIAAYQALTLDAYLRQPSNVYVSINTGRALTETATNLRVLLAGWLDLPQTHADAGQASGQPIQLGDLIGTGNERHCFVHPENPRLCVKVKRAEVGGRRQNEIDQAYSKFLSARSIHLPHIPKCHGWTETSHGPGLVMDRACREDLSPAPTLLDAVKSGEITLNEAHVLLNDTFARLLAHNVVVTDANLDHLVLAERKDGSPVLLVIDGLGSRFLGVKFWLRARIGPYARRKTRKVWKKLGECLEVEAGRQPGAMTA